MPNSRDLDARQQHQDQGNPRLCSLHGTVLSRVASALALAESLEDSQA
jgi:hypothetical protein